MSRLFEQDGDYAKWTYTTFKVNDYAIQLIKINEYFKVYVINSL